MSRTTASFAAFLALSSISLAGPSEIRVAPHPAAGPFTARILLTGTPGDAWLLAGSAESSPLLRVSAAGVLDADGTATADVRIPTELLDETLEFRGAFLGGSTTLSEPVPFACSALFCEPLSFDYDRSGAVIAGEALGERWSDSGLHVEVRRRTPAIAFDSSAPTANDGDLVTPGPGLFNSVAYGNVLVLGQEGATTAELLADPDADDGGGYVRFRFDEPVQTCAITLLDVDEGFGARIRRFHEGALVDALEVRPWNDSSIHVVPLEAAYVDEVMVRFAGTGAVAELQYLPCPRILDFDRTTTGIPLGVLDGEFCDQQFLTQDFELSAFNASGGPDAVIALDRGADGIVLAIAADGTDGDADGIADNPAIESAGGTITLDFALCTNLKMARLSELGGDEATARAYDMDGLLLFEATSVNGVVDFQDTMLVRKVEFELVGAGVLAEMRYCPTPGADL